MAPGVNGMLDTYLLNTTESTTIYNPKDQDFDLDLYFVANLAIVTVGEFYHVLDTNLKDSCIFLIISRTHFIEEKMEFTSCLHSRTPICIALTA